MKKHKLSGCGAAMITPFKANMEIDWERLASMINYVIEGGTDYIVALGTTAETPTLSKEEKRDVIRFFKQQIAGRVPLVIGAGGNNTLALTKELQEMELDGVEAILSVTPYYNKPSQEGLYRHFEAVAKASPVPVILYNVPGRTGVNMSADTTCRLARDFDNIIAVKEASGKIDQIEQIIKNCPKDFLVLSGDDGMTVDVMRKGGDGVISVAVNAFPKRFSHVVYLAKQGLFDRAEEAYAPLHEAVCALFEQGNPVGVKAALTILNQIENNLRLPLVPATELLMKKMERLIREYELC
ncbi:MAG: 4-hydroxy-tetrahydrodipicolinate synthase [Alistipes sp.]|jgi:4-hydroxy-tetrahydrodipicolinate synthase|nr:4-hydroxy-tetrahydrodipicolinate synthase [Alistipes sp.]